MATKLFGFEGIHTVAAPPEDVQLLAAPGTGKKRVVISLSIRRFYGTGTDSVAVSRKVGSTYYPIHSEEYSSGYKRDLQDCQIELVDNESLWLQFLDASVYLDDWHWDGVYADVD